MICDNTCTDNWQLFEQELCLWDVSVFGFRGTKITSTQIHFYIFLLAYESSVHSFCFYDPG